MLAPKKVLLTTIENISRILEVWEEKRLVAEAKYSKEQAKKPGIFRSGPNPDKLSKLTQASGAVSREQKNLIKLNNALTTLTTQLSPENKTAISQIREVMMIHYIDEYAYGRVRKEGSELLKAIEDVILNATANSADNFFLKNEHLALKKGKGHEHFDSRFLVCQYAIVDPELPKVVAHIFDHIMNASLVHNDKNFEIYTACMKALVRVGLTVSPSEWNALVSAKMGNTNANPFQITVESVLNAKEHYSEKGIQSHYGNIKGLESLYPDLYEKVKKYAESTPAGRALQEVKANEVKDNPVKTDQENISNTTTQADAPSSVADHTAMQPPPLLSSFRPASPPQAPQASSLEESDHTAPKPK
jgi:hypothetical protein